MMMMTMTMMMMSSISFGTTFNTKEKLETTIMHFIFLGGGEGRGRGVNGVHYGKCEMVNYYSYDKEQLPKVVKIIHSYTSLTSLILFVFRATFITVNRTFLSPAYRFAFLGTCFSVTHRSKTITIFIYIFLISLSRTLDCRFFKRPKNLWNRPANACCWKRVYGEHLRCGKFTPQAQDYLNHKFDP